MTTFGFSKIVKLVADCPEQEVFEEEDYTRHILFFAKNILERQGGSLSVEYNDCQQIFKAIMKMEIVSDTDVSVNQNSIELQLKKFD